MPEKPDSRFVWKPGDIQIVRKGKAKPAKPKLSLDEQMKRLMRKP